MFHLHRPASPPSCSTDDQSSRPRRLFQRRNAHDLTTSSLHSLAVTRSHHDDLPTPSHPTSTHSTPMTSPSTGHSSLCLPGSLSSVTSESVPCADSKARSEFGMLMPGSSSAYSAVHGSTSSRSSNPASRALSRSPTEPDPTPRFPRRRPSDHFSSRPATASRSPPMLATAGSFDSSPVDHHTRSHSRLTVSIKNIFSRHALPSPSRSSFNSTTATPPESEASFASFHAPPTAGKWSMTPRKSRPPDLEISGSVVSAIPSPGRGSNAPIDAHRRYASEAAAEMHKARTGDALPTSQESIHLLPRNTPPVRGSDPKTRNVLRRRPSGSAKLFKGRERGMSTPSRPNQGDTDHLHPPPKDGISREAAVAFPLTPAGAVVEAYKQQELNRNDTSSPPKLSIDDRMSSTASHEGRNHSPAPYHTVFGVSSERRLSPGGPDDRWARFQVGQRLFTPSQPTLSHQPSMSDPGGHSLSRKLSSRWRKVKGGGVMPEESPLRHKGHSKERPSLQDIWGNDKPSLRPTGRSMDGASNPGDGAWASPSAAHARSASKDKMEGPKLWRLMRRISTGGLRDRFQSDKAVPPVPAIPKELLQKTNPAKRSNGPPPSSPRHPPSSSLYDKDHMRSPTAPRNIGVIRPSIATSSSSPGSSDVASAQFFRKSHSPRSSVSSYGEAVVLTRAPEAVLDRHIITPLEQLRLGDRHAESAEPCMPPVPRSPRRSMSVPAGLRENGEGDHLSLPSPRRQTCSGESPSSSSSRPPSTSPPASGSAHTSYRASLTQSRMADGTVALSPPPRPARNSARGGSNVAGSPSHSIATKHMDGGARIGLVRQIDRTPSGQSDITARFGTPEPRQSQSQARDRDQDASPHKQAQFTFRELDAPRRPPLTEREKADIWNDLLARSDKAGGTLHINGATELMSDSMRLSTHSEV